MSAPMYTSQQPLQQPAGTMPVPGAFVAGAGGPPPQHAVQPQPQPQQQTQQPPLTQQQLLQIQQHQLRMQQQPAQMQRPPVAGGQPIPPQQQQMPQQQVQQQHVPPPPPPEGFALNSAGHLRWFSTPPAPVVYRPVATPSLEYLAFKQRKAAEAAGAASPVSRADADSMVL
ncbi:hypothetical protein H9P43_007047 [Blastocladiella emersonii ATCC 22665]|nr:hypothetical protein H9P43_007047 [Blastocladiella emersonii ATCC 22665]